MKIVNDDVTLRIVDSTGAIAFAALAGWFLCLLGWLFHLAHNAPTRGEVLGLSIGVAMFLFGGLMFCRKADFQFDRYGRKLVWRRGGLFGKRGGVVPFDEIQEVAVESTEISGGDGKSTGYRLVLRLKGAEEDGPPEMPTGGKHFRFRARWGAPKGILPISEGYSSSAQKSCEEIAARIREVLRNPKA